MPPNPLAWYALSSALSLAHFAAFFTIVGVHHVQISRGRRQTGDRERRVGAPASPQVWRGRQDSVRAPATPSIHGHRGESDADVSDFSDELNSDDDVDPGDDEDGEDGELSGTDSSEDEHDLIDIPRPGAPSLRHRASRTSWRGPGDEESAGQEHSRGEMTRSFSRRSGLSFRGASSAEGGGYGSLSIGKRLQLCRPRVATLTTPLVDRTLQAEFEGERVLLLFGYSISCCNCPPLQTLLHYVQLN